MSSPAYPSRPPGPAGISRRALLTAGAGSAVALAAGSGLAVLLTDEEPIPQPVLPLWSEQAYRSFGVVSHPTFQSTTYGYADAWLDALADIDVRYFRGLYADHLPLVQSVVEGARDRGLQWGMLVCNDLGTPPPELSRRIADIARNAADLCLFVEGVNEPNYVRGGGTPPADWAERAVALQRTIFQAVRSHPQLDHVTVVGPSLQTFVATEADYERMASLGLGDVIDAAGLHSYPSGRYPSRGLDDRLLPLQEHFPDVPVWLTETGYTNAVGRSSATGGATPVPDEVAAAYAPALLLEAVDRGLAVAWYEALDDPDPGAKDDTESAYGLVAVGDSGAPSTWRPKPAATALADFLAQLRDPGPAYRPRQVRLAVASPTDDVRWTALAKRDGSTWLHLRRAVDVWDTDASEPVTVEKVPVTVLTPSGRRTVRVGSTVVSVRL